MGGHLLEVKILTVAIGIFSCSYMSTQKTDLELFDDMID